MGRRIEIWMFRVNGGEYLMHVNSDQFKVQGAAIIIQIVTVKNREQAMKIRGSLEHAQGFAVAVQRIFNVHLTPVLYKQ